MGSLNPVDVDIVVGKHGTSHGGNADCRFFLSDFLEYLGNEFVHDTMAATGAVVHVHII